MNVKLEEKKENVKENYSSGSISFQILALRSEIENLQFHLSKNKSPGRKGNEKDIPAKRALLKKVAKVKRFLNYLRRKNPIEFKKFEKTKIKSNQNLTR